MTDLANITLTYPDRPLSAEREPFQCRRCGKLWSECRDGWVIWPEGEVCNECKREGEGE